MENRFVFIIPFRNVANFINDCANSLIHQDYKNWIAIFCDDQSTDNTINNIPKDDRFTISKTQERITALPNIHYGIVNNNLNDEDIICILDGDDALIRKDAIDILNNLYNDDTLLTYGQYINSYNNGIGHCKPYTKEEFITLRTGGYWASHIRTFKYKLYKELINQDPDLLCYKDNQGNFYTTCYDICIMTPLMEICGFDRIKFNPEPVYYYRLHQNNDHVLYGTLQKSTEIEVFRKPPFKQVNI